MKSIRRLNRCNKVAGLADEGVDGVHATVELAELHDAGEVADVLIVENDDAGWRVVADLSRERVICPALTAPFPQPIGHFGELAQTARP